MDGPAEFFNFMMQANGGDKSLKDAMALFEN